jgi:hypothetical protein
MDGILSAKGVLQLGQSFVKAPKSKTLPQVDCSDIGSGQSLCHIIERNNFKSWICGNSPKQLFERCVVGVFLRMAD